MRKTKHPFISLLAPGFLLKRGAYILLRNHKLLAA